MCCFKSGERKYEIEHTGGVGYIGMGNQGVVLRREGWQRWRTP